MPKAKKEPDISLEEMLSQINEIIIKMDQPDIPLDESFSLYREGVKLIQSCNEKIDKVEKEVTILNEGSIQEDHEF
ncbi:exodeoxyribonuclease VII small subunit [Parasporobacterium paucivorans]|uniref:Exodeoxyribonuclease 7 small subunit n=1 Tax=Parasporobacterium paucivorans DSM 15970 TaxID=1122934 RepID=A0A1M6FAT4_9FIRM|nr:exodeoxyribonuclease VII small subunit [Parasporobacterium paucivorans]SHI94878.1 Exodeoxyribonuclease VII small subunit [Parasporobacterium paucivorans DSM 15970]